MSEHDWDVELERAMEVAPALDLVGSEDELPHLCAHHHAHHSLLDKRSSALQKNRCLKAYDNIIICNISQDYAHHSILDKRSGALQKNRCLKSYGNIIIFNISPGYAHHSLLDKRSGALQKNRCLKS
jgi:hypothetical protein